MRLRFVPAPIRASADSTGTILRPDRTLLALVFTALAAVIPSGILYCIYVPRGGVNISLSPGQRVFSPYLIGLLVLIAVWGLTSLAIRREAGHITLSPSGYEIISLGAKPVRGSWDNVVDITDSYKKAHHPVVLVLRDGHPHVLKNASGFAPNGAAVYWMVRHYWHHPEDRVELTNGRALDRLRSEDFDTN